MQNKMSNLKFILTEYGKQWQTISILTTMLTISYSPGYSTSDGDTLNLHKFLLRLNSESTIFLFYIQLDSTMHSVLVNFNQISNSINPKRYKILKLNYLYTIGILYIKLKIK